MTHLITPDLRELSILNARSNREAYYAALGIPYRIIGAGNRPLASKRSGVGAGMPQGA
jgi:hypothetical protein